MKGQNGSSRFDTVLKMLLIAFISLLAFSTGVYFGREMTQSDYQLKALETNFDESQQQVAAEKNKDYDVAEEDAIAAEDVETLTEKYVDAERDTLTDAAKTAAGVPQAPPPAASAKAAETATSKTRNVASANEVKPIVTKAAPHHDSDAEIAAQMQKAAKSQKPDLRGVQEAARRVASNAAPSVESKTPAAETRVPSSLPKSVGSATDVEYTVQIASYKNLEEAKSHANDLVKKGFPAYPVTANVKGQTWYRVSVGSFKSMKDAGQYRSQLMKQANLSSAIVQKIER